MYIKNLLLYLINKKLFYTADSESDEENNYNDDHDDDDNEQEIPRNVQDQINLLVAYLSSNAGRMQQ